MDSPSDVFKFLYYNLSFRCFPNVTDACCPAKWHQFSWVLSSLKLYKSLTLFVTSLMLCPKSLLSLPGDSVSSRQGPAKSQVWLGQRCWRTLLLCLDSFWTFFLGSWLGNTLAQEFVLVLNCYDNIAVLYTLLNFHVLFY